MFNGVRVLDVGTWVMVPAAAVLLADHGAEVIKVEHPRTGDPGRGLVTGGVSPSQGGVNLMVEQVNRGKRSIGLDIATDEGRAVLYELAKHADVFLTSYLPRARQKLKIDIGDIRAHNPNIIYVRADAVGPRGPEAGKPGYDSAVFFGRGGILNSFSAAEARPVSPRPGFGDKTASMCIAFGVASALFNRERTGEPAEIDVSLFGAAMWVASSDIVYSGALGTDFSRVERAATNPAAYTYQTADGRWIALSMLESSRWWGPLCRHLGRTDLIDDPRSVDSASRAKHAEELVAELALVFSAAPLAVWRERLATLDAPWEVVQTSLETANDAQAAANGYITEVHHPNGQTFRVVRSPVQFNGRPAEIGISPEAGQHTEEILSELGYDWDRIGQLKQAGIIP